MKTPQLKKFAQFARRSLIEQVMNKLKQVLAEDSQASRENADAVKKLQDQIKVYGKELLIEKIAYIWFNRFCALRFMDVNRYNSIGVISPAQGQFQPEILADAKMGHIDETMLLEETRQKIFALLDGSTPSRDPQSEAYRLLVVAACNDYHKVMPYLFEHIDDYTELLIPDDLLSGNSILAYTREAMTPDVCRDVEVIGWLYQFYISEKKDEVFKTLKKSKKITPENIPAATQLFTPHWIVRYLVENSLGRLWMLNRPNSKLIQQMNYYIKPEQTETDFLHISKPEELRICDPACGSGHMLTYAFDLLHSIYEEEGYRPADIPEKILTHNLFGIEIDERAGELAAFALTMKARARQPRFFRKKIQPNICVLEKIRFEGGELKDYMDFIGRDLFTLPLQTTLRQFEEADNFGSLIRPVVTDVEEMLNILGEKDVSEQLFLHQTHQRVLQSLRQADYLSSKYHVVIANPPYMGKNSMNGRLRAWAKDNYSNSKSDLFAMFIDRNLELVIKRGLVAMITMQSWMFLSSFEKLRTRLLSKDTILSMAHLGTRAFDSIGGEVVSTTAFVLENYNHLDYKGGYLRLVNGTCEAEKADAIREAIKNPGCGWFYHASTVDFKKIPGCPIAYWVSEQIRDIFEKEPSLGVSVEAKQGLGTGNDSRFFRFFWEVSKNDTGFGITSSEQAWSSQKKWFPLNKGGSFRKWYGNREYLIAYDKRTRDILKELGNHLPSEKKYFSPFISWSDITSAITSFRKFEQGFLFSNTGHCVFPRDQFQEAVLLAYCNNKFVNMMIKILNPTIHFHVGYFKLLPYPRKIENEIENILRITELSISNTRSDWDFYETSWEFTTMPLLHPDYQQHTLNYTYTKLLTHWREMTLEMQRLEEENNSIFIQAYGLQDELTPEVPLKEITLTCNPHYRYGGNKSEEELEALLLTDTMKEFISYAVGCMFGRYSLDKPGLILANQGETIKDYLKQIPEPSFPADDDNVIPILDGDWFADDITERFFKFLRVTFGEEHYEENLQFIEDAIGKDIRKYFLRDFYNDHAKRYKKRPIYWLFSSPQGSFNALIYMHRFRPDTVSVVLNDYLREFRTKLTSRKNHLDAVSISPSANQGEKIKALKEIEKLKKMIIEMEDYEREVLYPLATEQKLIDLDKGVKVNYNEFGKALKKITGLTVKGK